MRKKSPPLGEDSSFHKYFKSMVVNIMVENINLNQIAVVLSQLVHNYNELAQNWFKVFYDPTPDGNINLTYFDEDGILQSYTICNRAYDRRFILNGEGAPEGAVSALTGSIYQDTLNGTLYIKVTNEGTTASPNGWLQLQPLAKSHIYGQGAPVSTSGLSIGHLYTDTITGFLYTLTNNGWLQFASNYMQPDDETITLNSDAKIRAIGVYDHKTQQANKFVTLTLAEYNAITVKDANTFYIVTDED